MHKATPLHYSLSLIVGVNECQCAQALFSHLLQVTIGKGMRAAIKVTSGGVPQLLHLVMCCVRHPQTLHKPSCTIIIGQKVWPQCIASNREKRAGTLLSTCGATSLWDQGKPVCV